MNDLMSEADIKKCKSCRYLLDPPAAEIVGNLIDVIEDFTQLIECLKTHLSKSEGCVVSPACGSCHYCDAVSKISSYDKWFKRCSQ